MYATLEHFCAAAQKIDKPEAASVALNEVQQASRPVREVMLGNVLADTIPPESLASHLYVAAAVQVFAAKLAATLEAPHLAPVETGICPVCGSRPLASVVVGFEGAEGTRYAACSCCSTLWNEVRIKCLACGSTEGIGYREVESDQRAMIKAEVCSICLGWLKILYQNLNASLEPVADDVASLGLDLLMVGTEYRRRGINPLLLGY